MSAATEGLTNRRPALLQFDSPRPMLAAPKVNVTSFADMIGLAFKYRIRFLIALLGPPAIALLLIFVLPAVYRAQTSLVVGTGPEYLTRGDGTSIMTAPTTTKQEFINTEIELLTNPSIVEATIARVGLANLYPDLLTAQVGPQAARDTAMRLFEASLRVDPVKLSNVIRVTFDHGNGQMAARTLDQFIISYQDLHAKVFAGRRAGSYEERIAHDMKDLERLERTRAETKAAFGVYDLSQQRTALIQKRIEADRQLRQTVDRSDALGSRLAFLAQARSNIGSIRLSSETESNPAAIHATDVLIDLRQKQAALATVYDSRNPLVQRLRQQTDALQKQLADIRAINTRISLTPSPIATAIDQDLVVSQAELAPLKAKELLGRALIGVIGQKLQNLQQADIQLRGLDSRIADQTESLKITHQLYNKAKAADELNLSKMTDFVKTSQATQPDRPVAPDQWLFMVGGILAGLISACGILVFGAITNKPFVNDGPLEMFLGVPILGTRSSRATRQRSLE